MHIEPMVLSVKDASAFIGLSKSRLYELITNQTIEARKLGGRTVIPVSSLRDFVNSAPRVAA